MLFLVNWPRTYFCLLKKAVQTKFHTPTTPLPGHEIKKGSLSTGSTVFSLVLLNDSTSKLWNCAWRDAVCPLSQEISVGGFPGYGSVL